MPGQEIYIQPDEMFAGTAGHLKAKIILAKATNTEMRTLCPSKHTS